MPTLAYTYTTLRQALQDWPVNSGAAYVAALDTIVGLGEIRLVRDLNLEIFDHVTTMVVEAGDRIIGKPSNLIATRSLRLGPETFYLITEDEDVVGLEDGSGGILLESAIAATDTRTSELEQRSWDFCQEFSPDPVVTGRPRYRNDLNDTQWEIVPTADARYGAVCRYVRRPTDSLNSSAPSDTSWLSRSAPDALFAACLMEAEHYLKADDRYADFQGKYAGEILPVARAELRDSIRAGQYSPVKPAAQTVK